jgi:lipopolysaccharide transport system ATP-binding protein
MASLMLSDAVIRVDSLGKCYQVYAAPHDRLKQSIVPRIQRAFQPVVKLCGGAIKPRQYFREFWALYDVTFEVAKGETLGIIGQNGSGKSTLLQLIAGTLTPTLGSARVDGRVAALLELGSGFNPEFTGRENIYLNASVLGLTRDEIEQRLASILAFAEVDEFIDRPVKIYSSGMALRLAFAVIAHVDADILIIDEALAVGDAYFQQKCLRWLRHFGERNTILFCSHDTGAVMRYCRDAIWLDKGVMRAYGPAKDVCEAYMATMYAKSTGLSEQKVQPSSAAVGGRSSAPARHLHSLAQRIEVFEFNENSAYFGTGKATIVDVSMRRSDDGELNLIKGGEQVQVIVRARANSDIESPILGFQVKDRLGQPIFGDNTYLSYCEAPLTLAAGQVIEAKFLFDLPFLKSGDYAITAAIASGTIESHVQHHWLHDSMLFRVHSPFPNWVMIAVPMRSISVEVVDQQIAMEQP